MAVDAIAHVTITEQIVKHVNINYGFYRMPLKKM